jgi:excisionase family DNA binding protein
VNFDETMINEPMLRVDQVAKRLDCSKSKVYRLIEIGALLNVPSGERGYRVPEKSLIDYRKRMIDEFYSK